MPMSKHKNIYNSLVEAKLNGDKLLSVLIDPDKIRLGQLDRVIHSSIESGIDYFLIGGSLIIHDMLDYCLDILSKSSDIPLILFPGNALQINQKADAILLLSLISGRNPDLLIGHHVIAAPKLKESDLEIIPTGYVLIDGGIETTTTYISNTRPIPADKPEITACTAMAGEMLGLKLIYLEAGSGAKYHVNEQTIRAVKDSIDIPIVVGGGIRNPIVAKNVLQAGADMIVMGNATETNPDVIREIASIIRNKEFSPDRI